MEEKTIHEINNQSAPTVIEHFVGQENVKALVRTALELLGQKKEMDIMTTLKVMQDWEKLLSHILLQKKQLRPVMRY